MEGHLNHLEENLDSISLTVMGIRDEMEKSIIDKNDAIKRANIAETRFLDLERELTIKQKVIDTITRELFSDKSNIFEKTHDSVLVDEFQKKLYTTAVREYSKRLYELISRAY